MQPHESLTLFARTEFNTKNKQFIMCEKINNQNGPNNHTSEQWHTQEFFLGWGWGFNKFS